MTVEIVVVDCGSYDGCAEMLALEFPQVRFIQSKENIGFGRANNLGASLATGTFLLLLNPDTEMCEDSLTPLVRRFRSLADAGALNCRLLNSDGSMQMTSVQSFPTVLNQLLSANILRRMFPRLRLWGMKPLFETSGEPVEAEALSGACILISRKCFEAIGGFSPIFFMYGEDLDLCYRIRSAGWRCYHVPETSIVHHGGGSSQSAASAFSVFMMRESVYKFIYRHRGPISAYAYRTVSLVGAALRMCLVGPLLLFGERLRKRGLNTWSKSWIIIKWSTHNVSVPAVAGSANQHPDHSI
jgi:GT2 family glycosyltransferase